jgi:hypothetical protein
VSLNIKILIFFLLGGLSLYGQSFMYSYVDPCTRKTKVIVYDISTPIVVAYYDKSRAFTFNEMQNGTFDSWISDVYSQFIKSPCQGVLTSITATYTTNLVTNLVNTVLNLSAITSLSSINGIGTNVESNVNNGSNVSNKKENGNKQDPSTNISTPPGTQISGQTPGSTPPSDGTGGTPTTNGGSTPSTPDPTSNGGSTPEQPVDKNNGSSSGGSNGGKSGDGDIKNEKSPPKEKVEEVKTETQKTSSSDVVKTTSKAKTEKQKPAILLTGDIVGLQKTEDGSQDTRGTMSYTRVKGDGTASLGLSADYMINAKIGNFTAMKSWIGSKSNGNKHINLVSSGFSLMPNSISNTTMFIRVNSLKKLTFIYGGAGVFGKLFNEPMISTLAITGFMYKGKLAKKLDATIIVAAVYSPYTKYYTESLFEAKPIIVPFFNFNYKMTKTFGMGLTGGTTYMAGQNVINYQILMGAKLIL